MALIWTEEDSRGIEGLKRLVEEKGNCLIIPENAKNISITFDVLDYYKANNFIMDIYCPSYAVENHEDITGIRITKVGYVNREEQISQAMEYLKLAYELLGGNIIGG